MKWKNLLKVAFRSLLRNKLRSLEPGKNHAGSLQVERDLDSSAVSCNPLEYCLKVPPPSSATVPWVRAT